MPYAIQRSTDSGATFSQDLITTEDITLGDGSIARLFYCVKDSKDNTFIIATSSTSALNRKPKLIKVSKSGVKAVSTIQLPNDYHVGCRYISMSRDEKYILAGLTASGEYNVRIDVDFQNGGTILFASDVPGMLLSFYQDRYIWVASRTMLYVYDYESKALLASQDLKNILGLISSGNNTRHLLPMPNGDCVIIAMRAGYVLMIGTISFDGISTIDTKTITQQPTAINTQGAVLDKWGDLVILSDYLTGNLIKYSSTGVKIGDTITLSGVMYNLNTDKDGNYYYSNALGTYKVPKNTAQGQAIAPLNQHIKIRDNGMTTFGNNISGYNPAVFEQNT